MYYFVPIFGLSLKLNTPITFKAHRNIKLTNLPKIKFVKNNDDDSDELNNLFNRESIGFDERLFLLCEKENISEKNIKKELQSLSMEFEKVMIGLNTFYPEKGIFSSRYKIYLTKDLENCDSAKIYDFDFKGFHNTTQKDFLLRFSPNKDIKLDINAQFANRYFYYFKREYHPESRAIYALRALESLIGGDDKIKGKDIKVTQKIKKLIPVLIGGSIKNMDLIKELTKLCRIRGNVSHAKGFKLNKEGDFLNLEEYHKYCPIWWDIIQISIEKYTELLQGGLSNKEIQEDLLQKSNKRPYKE